MYQGKHYKKSRKRSRRSMTLLVSLLLITTVTIGGTIAFLLGTDDPKMNVFTPSKVTTEVVEDLKNGVKENVQIKNTGDTDAWIRAAVVVTWQNADGDVYGEAPVQGTDYEIAYNLKNGWQDGEDDFYYWYMPVKAGESTGVLITSCKSVKPAPKGYYLNVEIIGSGIQSKPASVFDTEWSGSGLKVDDSADDPMQWILVCN